MHPFHDRLSSAPPRQARLCGFGCRISAQAAVVTVLAILWLFGPGSTPRAWGQINDIFRLTKGAFANHMEYHRIDLAPGKELVLADLDGPGKVTYFYYTDNSFEHGADGSGAFYDGLVLKVYWDGAAQPSIRVPLWAFFGVFGHKAIDYQSLPMQINHYNYMCYLPMPFSRHARFVLANDGDEEYIRPVAYGVDYESDPAFATEASRLHAAYSHSNPVRDGIHQLLDVNGTGQYIGNFLQVDTKWHGWWGEGDTLFQVDGNPMHHSPGTEDEYGACWGFEHTFSYLYSGYIQMDPEQNRMYRWYIANPVRFQKSLKVEIQNQRNEHSKQLPSHDDYTSVAFWYQEGAHPAPPLPPYAERNAPNRSAEYPRTPLK